MYVHKFFIFIFIKPRLDNILNDQQNYTALKLMNESQIISMFVSFIYFN